MWFDWRDTSILDQSHIDRVFVSTFISSQSNYDFSFVYDMKTYHYHCRDLSHNDLTGSVPEFLAKMPSLTAL